MGFWTSGHRICPTAWLRFVVVSAMGLTMGLVLNLAGCPKPTYTPMFPDITLADIMKITGNNDPTDPNEPSDAATLDSQSQALKDLGITDEQLIALLVNGPMPVLLQTQSTQPPTQ